jgi:hypothetical protein
MKFGRQPRSYDRRIPRYSDLREKMTAPPTPPLSVNYAAVLPPQLGMYGNDVLGDCTCAAVYHAIQTWTANANPPIDSEPQQDAVLLYEQACGYVPGHPNTDQGGNEQTVLKYWVNTGAPAGPSGVLEDKLAAFVEVNPANLVNVKQAIFECGTLYIGFNVPAYLDPSNTAVWDLVPNAQIVAGHAVVLIGYDAVGPWCITWGRVQKMTWAFFSYFTDEAYALADGMWIEKTGQSPCGLSLADLEALMVAISEPIVGNGQRRQHRRKKRRRNRS